MTSEILQPIPNCFLVVYLLKLSSECLVSYDPHFPGNDGTKKGKGVPTYLCGWSLGQRNGGVPTWVDLAGIDPRDQTQGI